MHFYAFNFMIFFQFNYSASYPYEKRVSISRDTLDESPMAYKPMDAILSRIGDTVEITERIIPVYNFKAGDEA